MPRPRWTRWTLAASRAGAAALSVSCLIDTPRGPFLGECAITPEGVYSWGDIEIGTCLAGPVDVAFSERDGTTWLLVSNADPYRNFRSGSLLAIEYDAIDRDVPTNWMHELPAFALPIRDDDLGDGTPDNAMLGEIGWLDDGRVLVPGRFTEDGAAGPSDTFGSLRAGRDELYIVDVADPTALPSAVPEVLTLRDDPFLVATDAASGLAWVGNLTDHSVSVLSVGGSVAPVDVATGPSSSGRTWSDRDASGSFAELVATIVVDRDAVPDDRWTATFVDGTARAYVPGVDGIVRYTSGGGTFMPSAFGPELVLPGEATYAADPFVFDLDGSPQALFTEVLLPSADNEGGSSIRYAVGADSGAADWSLVNTPTLLGSDGYDSVIGGPSLTYIDGIPWLYYDGRPSFDAPSCIFVARADDGATFERLGASVGDGCDAPTAAGFEQVAQPYVIFDPAAKRYRMWMSAHDGSRWTVALSASADGVQWSEPVAVDGLGDDDVGGPSVVYATDRYRMTVSVRDGDQWIPSITESADGVHWEAPRPITTTDPDAALPDLGRPLRVGLAASSTSSWQLAGADLGPLDTPLITGSGAYGVLGEGMLVAVTGGQAVSNASVPARWARDGLRPNSVVTIDGVTRLFATATAAGGSERVVAFDRFGATWQLVEPFDAIDAALAGAGRSAADPVVVADDDGFVMFYAHTRGAETRIRRATSADGRTWTAEGTDLIGAGEDWDLLQRPHSVDIAPDGLVTLWYTGDDTSRGRIGAATATSLRGGFTRSAGEFDPWRFGPGTAGSFDDSGVKDPLVMRINGVRHLYYAGFDGDFWHIGHAVEQPDGSFARRLGADALSLSAMSGLGGTLSAQGVASPAVVATADDTIELLTSGFDGIAWRIGGAVVIPSEPDVVYANTRRPTAGDTVSFETHRSGGGVSVIELAQAVDDFITDGVGMAEMVHDPDRGFLFITSKLSSGIFVIDVRDDSEGDFVDRNVMDIEAILRPAGGSAAMGFRGLQVASERGLLYATATQPDGLWVFDLDALVDDDLRNDQYLDAIAVLPLPTAARDAGARSQAPIGGAGMALAGASDELLLVSHFRDNSLIVFDLDRGFVGEEVAYIPFIGENPHVVRVAPDGLTAVVANYTGDVVNDLSSSTLMILDLDPTRPTWLQPLTWIKNR